MDVVHIWILIVILGLVFDFTNGSHDSANVVSTVIATKALRPFIAIIFASILNAVGATQISKVAETITTGLINPAFSSDIIIFCALLGAIAWNIVTIFLGLPSSSSYALVGGLVGAALMSGGSSIIYWGNIFDKVILPMIFSPLVGFLLAFLIMKGLYYFCSSRSESFAFKYMQIASSGFVALSHGFNDAQKSMAIITLGLFSGGVIQSLHIPIWVILLCALMMGLGTATGGYRIIKTVGFSLTNIEPIQGFAAETSASFIISTASFLGFPISSTQMIVGSVTGVGSAKKLRAVRWLVVRKLCITWLITLPGSGIVSALAYFLLQNRILITK